MKLYFRLLLLALTPLFLFTCEDPVTLDSRFEGPELVVDAWVNNISEPQTIILTETQDYYDNRLPTPVTDAQVIICQTENQLPTANCFVFDHQGDGNYVWEPAVAGQTLGEVGTEFGLGIQRGDQQYAAVTNMSRTARLDSISFQFEEEALGLEEGLYAQLYARDPVGQGDAYLIRSTINDTLLVRPSELNLAYDATFSPGTNTDGITFIFPIRFAINKQDDDGAPIPLVAGDKVAVEVLSISQEAYLFLRIVQEQVNNGQSGLFDLPVANSPGNVFNVDTEESIRGFFNVAAAARAERVVEE
ncbi:MAG: DUF4249 family protein [Lewinella sp.]